MSNAKEANGRKLINGKDDVVKLSPIKYTWAWDAYHAANCNHWLPQEIQMQKDIEQWNTPGVLTDNEKHVVKTALGFFTTADSLVANNLVLLVYAKITAPECRMYLLRQAYEEAIHTHSYQHIVQSLGLDEEEIFNKYREVETIYNKDNFVSKLANSLTEPDSCPEFICIESILSDQLKHDKGFLEALIDFYVIMEGIFFYASFAAIMSFKRRNLLPGTVEQFQYIMRDESMHMNFGIDLINGIKEENPHLWTEEFQNAITGKIKRATELESLYAKTLVGPGMLGMSADSFREYVQYIADRRLQSIGLPACYQTRTPFPWMSEITDLNKQKNFFESRVTEYKTGGALEWT
jgi:ribonucleoside-diphosphate reductase beta chain